jgi:hypothetical protein
MRTNLSFLLGIMYTKFHPTERSKGIRIYFQATETPLLDLFLKRFGGIAYKHKTYTLYEILSEKDLRHFRSIVIKSRIPMLQPWRVFLDYYAPLPKRLRGKNRRILKLYKEERAIYNLTTNYCHSSN